MKSYGGRFLSFLVCGAVSFGAVAPATAASTCREIFRGNLSSPLEILSGALTPTELDRSRAADRFVRKLQSIDPEKNFSEADLRQLVLNLQNMKLGKITGRKYLRLGEAEYLDARLLREMQTEIGTRGLVEFYRDRGLLVDRSRLMTKLRGLMRDQRVNYALTALTLPTLLTHRPFFFLPYDNRFELTPTQFETLLVDGVNSPAGRNVMSQLTRLGKSQQWRDRFVRNFNRVAFVVSVAVIYMYVSEEVDERAKARGDVLIADLAEKAAKIEARGEPDTKEDIHFDVVQKHLEEKFGRSLDEEEHAMLCVQVPAPGRCS